MTEKLVKYSLMRSYFTQQITPHHGERAGQEPLEALEPSGNVSEIYQCPHCDYQSVRRFKMKAHIMSKHTADRPFKCHFCTKNFAARSHLQEHIRIHTGEKPFQCPVCFKRFTQRGNLGVHVRTIHHSNANTIIRCDHKNNVPTPEFSPNNTF